MSLSCHSPSWQWLPECCWQQTRQIQSDGAGSGSERFVFKNGLGQNFLCSKAFFPQEEEEKEETKLTCRPVLLVPRRR